MVLPVCMFILDAARFWELANTGGSSEARDGDKDETEGEPLNGKLLRDIGKEKQLKGSCWDIGFMVTVLRRGRGGLGPYHTGRTGFVSPCMWVVCLQQQKGLLIP